VVLPTQLLNLLPLVPKLLETISIILPARPPLSLAQEWLHIWIQFPPLHPVLEEQALLLTLTLSEVHLAHLLLHLHQQ